MTPPAVGRCPERKPAPTRSGLTSTTSRHRVEHAGRGFPGVADGPPAGPARCSGATVLRPPLGVLSVRAISPTTRRCTRSSGGSGGCRRGPR